MDDELVKEMLEYYDYKVPNQNQYPLQFAFLIRGFEHMKRMKSKQGEVVKR